MAKGTLPANESDASAGTSVDREAPAIDLIERVADALDDGTAVRVEAEQVVGGAPLPRRSR